MTDALTQIYRSLYGTGLTGCELWCSGVELTFLFLKSKHRYSKPNYSTIYPGTTQFIWAMIYSSTATSCVTYLSFKASREAVRKTRNATFLNQEIWYRSSDASYIRTQFFIHPSFHTLYVSFYGSFALYITFFSHDAMFIHIVTNVAAPR